MTANFDFRDVRSTPVRSVSLMDLPARPDARSYLLPVRRSFYAAYGKRVLDVVLVLIAAPVILPLVLFLALLVALQGGRPIYVQERVGKDGRVFRMLKLRTMVIDADARLAAYLAQNPAARAEWTRNQKLKRDPRVTRLGAILRRTSLDELPQLWNVLTGDMSLVGPRPMMVNQQSQYPGRAYYRMRPGLTGAWQVSQRHNTSFAERSVFDGDYERRLSLSHDLGIIGRTFGAVIGGTGC